MLCYTLGLGIDIVVIPETPRDSPVSEEPEIVEKAKDLQITEAETAKFEFKVKHTKSASVRWVKDSKPLIESGRIQTSREGETFSLEIREVVVDDEALYECYVSNDAGEVRCEMELLVDGAFDLQASFCSLFSRYKHVLLPFRFFGNFSSNSSLKLPYLIKVILQMIILIIMHSCSTIFHHRCSNVHRTSLHKL